MLQMNMNQTLVKMNANGKEQYWKVDVQDATISVEWGVKDGKFQTNVHKVTEGKQKRTKEEQAVFEAKSLMEKKLRTGYCIPGQVQAKSPLPMLAKEFKMSMFEGMRCAIQPKLDGIRCLANVKTGELWSRKQTKILGLGHISKALKESKFPDNVTWLDGELYLHNTSFNDISSKVRRTANFTNESMEIQYWVYDCVSSLEFTERIKILKNTIVQSKQIILTPTQFVELNNDIVTSLHKEATNEKYEGIMIRKSDSKYEIGKRSSNLLKFKDFCQEEFKVIGFKQKKVVNGSITLGSVILCSFSDENMVFSATPTMTNDEKMEIWKNKENYIGKIATVKYFEKTPKGIPRFPRLIGFRHHDDC